MVQYGASNTHSSQAPRHNSKHLNETPLPGGTNQLMESSGSFIHSFHSLCHRPCVLSTSLTMRAESSTVIINVPAVCDILLWDPGSMPKPSLLFYLLLFKLITCRFRDNFTYRWRLKVICTCKYTQRRKTLIWNTCIRFWRGCLRLVHFGKQRT